MNYYKCLITDNAIAPGQTTGSLILSAEILIGHCIYRNPIVEDSYLLSPELPRGHFRQRISRHVKGKGAKGIGRVQDSRTRTGVFNQRNMILILDRPFEPDGNLFQPGGFDIEAGRWWSGSEGKRQLEAELAGRL